jgi:hypothetical protein
MRNYTPENIIKLEPNEIFVFGSNTEGRHGAGAARTALIKFGAIYGQAKGLQGQSYAIITTELGIKGNATMLNYIKTQLIELIGFADNHPELTFYVTKIGCCLAGFNILQIKMLFSQISKIMIIPDNIILPFEFEYRK